MKFFIDVHFCEYSKWNLFGLLSRPVETRPMELAIVSEAGDIFTAFFASVAFPWRIMDKKSKELDLQVRRNGRDETYDCYDNDDVVLTAVNEFIRLYRDDGDSELILADDSFFINSNIPAVRYLSGAFTSMGITSVMMGVSIYVYMSSFVDAMPDKCFEVDGPFEVVLFRNDKQDHFTHLQKMDMFTSHSQFPVRDTPGTLNNALRAKKIYDLIKKVKTETCDGK